MAGYVAQRAIQRGPGPAGGPGFAATLSAYALVTCGLFALYAVVLFACSRRRVATARERRLAILLPVAFNVVLLPTAPALSIDVYSYISHGYIQAVLRRNPYVVRSRAVAGTPIGRELAAYGWRPVHPVSPYGPILTHLERGIVTVTGNVRFQIVMFKALAVLASLGSAAVIWAILGLVRPDRQLLGTVAYLWNPLIVWEFAGEGHNDALMTLFILLAIASALQRRHAAGIVMMSIAVLTKYIPLMLAPLLAMHAARTTTVTRRRLGEAALASSIMAVVTWGLFRPLWVGVATFGGVRVNGAPGSTGSTPTMVLEALDRVAPWVTWEGLIWASLPVALAVWVAWRAWRVTDGAGLVKEAALVWAVYVLLFSPSYWPWYAAPALALLALVPERPFLELAFALSFSARLAAPLVLVFVHELISRPVFLGSMWALGVGLPLLLLALRAPVLAAGRSRS